MIRQTVPFFGVSSMADSLSHYVDHLGFTLNPHLGAGWPDPLVLAAARGRGVKLKSTPLGYAARYGHEKLAAFLVERGASPQLPDDEAWGPQSPGPRSRDTGRSPSSFGVDGGVLR
jgi:hypothetical protein